MITKCLHGFKTGLEMVVLTVKVTTELVEFFQPKFLEFEINFWVLFSTLFTKFTFIFSIEMAHFGGIHFSGRCCTSNFDRSNLLFT